jgi:uncharacterized membrane protein YadS
LSLAFALKTHSKGKITIPWFIFLFLGAATANNFFPESVRSLLTTGARQALCLVLFWIGSSMNKASLAQVGWKPFLLAIGLWIVLASSSLAYVLSLS